MSVDMTRRNFVGASAAVAAGLGAAAALTAPMAAKAEEAAEGAVLLVNGSTTADGKIDPSLAMPAELGREWHEFKNTCDPLYPGYTHYDEYLNYIKDKLTEYGCVDILEHHFDFESYLCEDWPERHDEMQWIKIDGENIPVATHVQLCGADMPAEGITAEMCVWDMADGEPEEGAFEGKIVVMKPAPFPEPPYTESFMGTYVITDTNYRSDPQMEAGLLEICQPEFNCDWVGRWDFGQWGNMNQYSLKGGAVGTIILSALPWTQVFTLIDRQKVRNPGPVLVVDNKTAQIVEEAALAGKEATMGMEATFKVVDNWNFLYFLPGKNYGTDADEYITINSHSDAMNLVQDNGALGTLGIFHYFSQIPQEQRNKTLVACVDTRHFIEGFETGNFANDPYQIFPEVVDKVSVTVGIEHMGSMGGKWDPETGDMVPNNLPNLTFMKADDNDWCTDVLIQAAIDSEMERADVKIDGRPGNSGKYKGLVRAVQASTHKLGKAVIGQAGSWTGTNTQEATGIEYWGEKKFRDEVYTWTQVVANMMDTPSIVYDICWSNLNTAIRNLGENKANIVDDRTVEGMIKNVSNIFTHCVKGDYELAAKRLELETIRNAKALAGEYSFDADFTGSDGTGDGSSMFVALNIPEGEEWLAVVKFAEKVVEKLRAQA